MRAKILLFLLLCFSAAQARAADTVMPYISVDLSGRVLAHNQAFDRWYPASLTKMMTAYVTFRALQSGAISLQTPIKLSSGAAHVAPSRSPWRSGSTLTLNTALTVMLVKSANDMANAVAEAVKGSQAAFVDEMNAQAQRLGMIGTHFANPSGLPDEQNYSTARDIAVLAVQLRRDFPQYAHYFDIPAIDFGKGRKVQPNSNNLIGRYSGADGMKTGFICASGFNLAASATRGERTIIAVVLGAPRIDVREETAAKLLSQGFETAGKPQVSLATLRPYGGHLEEAANLREAICNAKAGQQRLQYRDEKGKPIFSSPFIITPEDKPEAVPVQALYEPEPPAKQSSAKQPSAKKKQQGKRAVAHRTAKTKSAAKGGRSSAAQTGGGIKSSAAAKGAESRAESAGQSALPPPASLRVPAPQSRPL